MLNGKCLSNHAQIFSGAIRGKVLRRKESRWKGDLGVRKENFLLSKEKGNLSQGLSQKFKPRWRGMKKRTKGEGKMEV